MDRKHSGELKQILSLLQLASTIFISSFNWNSNQFLTGIPIVISSYNGFK